MGGMGNVGGSEAGGRAPLRIRGAVQLRLPLGGTGDRSRHGYGHLPRRMLGRSSGWYFVYRGLDGSLWDQLRLWWYGYNGTIDRYEGSQGTLG